uniref:Uncharacterized protein n=1 Tax=Romanomermis culicivorax TaxID=13658 RepID=A0A915KKF7_ROMCU
MAEFEAAYCEECSLRHGIYQVEIFNENMEICIMLASYLFHKTLSKMTELKPQLIYFLHVEELKQIQAVFGFPGVEGAFDSTHIPIIGLGGVDSELYRNREGFFSINA